MMALDLSSLLAFTTGKEHVINLIESELNFTQYQILVHQLNNDRHNG